MKEKKPFKVGATYKLKKKYINDFYWSPELVDKFRYKSFEFTVSNLSISGHAMCHPDLCQSVANTEERHMFTRVDNK